MRRKRSSQYRMPAIVLASVTTGGASGVNVMANYVDGAGLRLFFILAVALLSGLLFYATTPAEASKKNVHWRTRVSSL